LKITANNYLEYQDFQNTTFLDEAFWYTRPEINSLSQLSTESQENYREGCALLPVFKSVLQGQIEPNGAVSTCYIAYESDGLKITYPSKYETFYNEYSYEQVICPKIFTEEPFIMVDYDPRCRDYYIDALKNDPTDLFFGPYSSAGNDANSSFFAGTVSKTFYDDGNLKSVISIDLSLNDPDDFVSLLGINDDFSYSFIVSLEGKPLFHSKFKNLDAKTISLTKLEFSDSSEPLSTEIDTEETRYFNTTIFPEIIAATGAIQLHYTSLGSEITLTAVPINIKTLWPEDGEVYTERRGVACIGIESSEFLSAVNDRSGLWLIILIIMGIFLSIFFLFLLIIWYLFYRIASYSLRPIKTLTKKIKVLLLTDKELSHYNQLHNPNLSQTKQNITSKEAKDLYATCSELLITHRFAKNKIDKNDAIAIMDFADAYSVLDKNEQARGICLTNIAHIHFRNKNYSKASMSYKEGSSCAKRLMDEAKENNNNSEFQEYFYFYRKRTYYQTISKFQQYKAKGENTRDEQWLVIEKQICKTKQLISKMKSADDLMIILHLSSSYCCMMMKRLISADNYLKEAQDLFTHRTKINVEDRLDIPVIPSCILLQKLYLQRGILYKEYDRKMQACMIFTKLLKIGKVYDPVTRMEALTQLNLILSNPKYNNINSKPEIKNIKIMLELFRKDKVKDIVLLIDNQAGDGTKSKLKKLTALNIFDSLQDKDRISLITISRKVNVVFSLSEKSKNTTQLRNQLVNMSWDETSR